MNWQYILKAGPWNVKNMSLYYENTFAARIHPNYYTEFNSDAIDKSVNSMLNGIWANLKNVDFIPSRRVITIEGESGTPYELWLNPTDFCKFDVLGSKETPIGYVNALICIDPLQKLPYGDMLGSYLLSLSNDVGSAANVTTLYSFLYEPFYTEVYCNFCRENSHAIPTNELTEDYSCSNCNVFSCMLRPSDEEIDANEKWFVIETYDEKYTCPVCNDELEMFSNMTGYCEKDRLYFIEEDRYPLMRIHGEIAASDDFTDLFYQGQEYRYIGDGIDVEEVEE